MSAPRTTAGHGHGHGHRPARVGTLDAGHAFDHVVPEHSPSQRRALGWALGVNAVLLVVEITGGAVFGSLALLADAAHLVSDVAGLAISLGAALLTSRPISRAHSFGLARAEVLAAQISAVLLLGAGAWILLEAVARLSDPSPVQGRGLAAVATLGLLVNGASAVAIHRAQGSNLNMRASFVHLATDAAGSLGALGAGVAVWLWGWTAADTIVSMATAALVLWAGWRLLRECTHVLMEGTPRGLDPEQVTIAVQSVTGVVEAHHLHLWNLASDVPAASAHVTVVGDPSLREAQAIAEEIRIVLAERFDLTNVTLELESAP